jgi:predicted secreted Zn-dependent protease
MVKAIEEVCYDISGQSTQELFDRIIESISSGEISR